MEEIWKFIPNYEGIYKISTLGNIMSIKNGKRKAIIHHTGYFVISLNKNGIKGYRLHWKKATGTPDIAFPGKKIAIFINGCFWHRCSICNPSIPKSNIDFWNKKFQRNIERDELKFKILKEQGWTVVVVWECQIRKDLSSQIENLSKFVKLDH